MRFRRRVVVAVVGAAALLLSGCTPALVRDVTFGDARLGLEGATVEVLMTFKCEPGYNVAFGTASLAQSNGSRLAQGFGLFEKAFPGAPCTGRIQGARVTVFNGSPWVFEAGTAVASGDVTLFNEDTGELLFNAAGPRAIHIADVAPRPAPQSAGRPTPDPRYGDS